MRSASALGKVLLAKLKELDYCIAKSTSKEILNDPGLKSSILDDRTFSTSINTDSSFTIESNPHDICLSMLRDYYYGYQRITHQWNNVTKLGYSENNVAWTLVSAYYCAFFGSIESLRLCGIPLITFNKNESERFFNRIGGPHSDTLSKKRSFVGRISDDFSSIAFISGGEKPHQLTWEKMKSDVLSKVPDKVAAWPEILKFKSICQGKNGWELPSDIRNRWNYRDSAFFDYLGKAASQPFLKIIKDEKTASNWIQSQSGIKEEKDAAASIASLAQLIKISLSEPYEYGLMSSSNIDWSHKIS